MIENLNCGNRQMDVPARPPGLLSAEIKRERWGLEPRL